MKLPFELSKEEEEEYYGPIDGVRPEDHPEAYQNLRKCFCLTLANNVELVYISILEYRLRLCVTCYISKGQPEIYEPYTSWHSIWVMTPEWSPYKLNCEECGDRLFKLKRAYRCTECIEECFESEEELFSKEDQEIEVLTRW